MHSIKKIIPRILVIILVLACYGSAVQYLYQPRDEVAPYIKKELDESAGNIDTLFVGTSTAYHGWSPQIWDQQMGGYSFNIASASQSIKDSYLYLKQECERNPVERVFLGVSPKGMMKEELSLKAKIRVYDCLSPLNKLAYLKDHASIDEWMYLTFYPVRVEDYFDLSEVKKNVKYKLSEEYKENIYPGKAYQGQGYFAPEKKFKGEAYTQLEKADGTWDASQVNMEEVEYLEKIIQYCKEKNIEFIMVYLPVTGKQIARDGSADEIHEFFAEIAEENGVEFWDFLNYKNLVEEYTNDKFKDAHHLNKEGGTQFSNTFVEIYQAYQNGEDLSQYFGDHCDYYQ